MVEAGFIACFAFTLTNGEWAVVCCTTTPTADSGMPASFNAVRTGAGRGAAIDSQAQQKIASSNGARRFILTSMAIATPDNEARHARSPLPDSLVNRFAIRLRTIKPCKSPVILHAGERE